MTDWEILDAAEADAHAGPAAGDGVFETLRIRHGQLTLAGRHFGRLREGLARLGVEGPVQFHEALQSRCAEAARGLEDRVLRVTVQVAGSDRGYGRQRPHRLRASLALRAAPPLADARARAGVAVQTCAQRCADLPGLAGIKHLNRLAQILATAEWQQADCAEGLMLDPDGHLVCGTRSNVFFCLRDAWCTPLLDRCGVAGTMRAHLLQSLAGEGVAVREVRVNAGELGNCSAMFLCNSVFGVWPVVALDGRPLPLAEEAGLARRIAADALQLER